MCVIASWLPVFVAAIVIPSISWAARPQNDGACGLVGLYAFTDARGRDDEVVAAILREFAYSYSAAQLLAIEHFNARNNSIIGEISELVSENCTVYFPELNVHDSEMESTSEFQGILKHYDRYGQQNLCGAIGEAGSRDAITLVDSIFVPYALYGGGRSYGNSPTVITTYLTNDDIASAVVKFLRSYGYANLGILSGGRAGQDALARSLTEIAEASNITVYLEGTAGSNEEEEIRSAVASLQENGYRVISIAPSSHGEAETVARVCDELGMLTNDYLYLLDQDSLELLKFDLSPTLKRLFDGSAFISSLDGFDTGGDSDPFLSSWRTVDATFQQRLNNATPIEMSSGYFQSNMPFRGSSHIYDAVMAIGIGACTFQEEARNSNRQEGNRRGGGGGGGGGGSRQPRNKARRVLQGGGGGGGGGGRLSDARSQLGMLIGDQSFVGASGGVNLEGGTRSKRGVVVGIINARLNNVTNELNLVLTNTSNGDDSFVSFQGRVFLFRNGSTDPPPTSFEILLFNHLGSVVQGIGLGLFVFAELLALFCFVAIVWMRNDRPVKMAQPPFILILCVGSALTSFTIFALSFDESDGISDKMLDANCTAAPWLFFVGLVSMYTALFCKMWRVDRVMQFRRKNQVKVIQAIWPLALMLSLTIAILTAWTIVDPWRWQRDFVSLEPPETLGMCTNDSTITWFGPLIAIMMASTFLALIAAWKTKSIPQNLSDTSTVFYAVWTQIQAWFVGVPVLSVIGNSSTNATYLGRVCLIWIVAVSPLVIVIGPRIIKAIKYRRNPSLARESRQRRQTRISGIHSIPQAAIRDSALRDSTIPTTRGSMARDSATTPIDASGGPQINKRSGVDLGEESNKPGVRRNISISG